MPQDAHYDAPTPTYRIKLHRLLWDAPCRQRVGRAQHVRQRLLPRAAVVIILAAAVVAPKVWEGRSMVGVRVGGCLVCGTGVLNVRHRCTEGKIVDS